MEYWIYGDLVKKVGKEIFYLQKGDRVRINELYYLIDYKDIDYDEKIVNVWVKKQS